MVRGIDRGTGGFAYFVPVTAVAGSLLLLGFAIDRLPLLPPSVSRGYQRWLVLVIEWLARPLDWWTDRPTEPVAPGVAGGSAR